MKTAATTYIRIDWIDQYQGYSVFTLVNEKGEEVCSTLGIQGTSRYDLGNSLLTLLENPLTC